MAPILSASDCPVCGSGGGGEPFACADLDACSISALSDVDTTGAADGDLLQRVGGVWVPVAPASSSGAIKARDVERYTAANITLNSTGAFVAVPDIGTVAVAADEDDILLLSVQTAIASTGAPTTNIRLDVATLVAGNPVNYFSGLAGGASDDGLLGWLANGVSVLSLDGAAWYGPVQAGDISGGTVTCGLRFRTVGANQLIAVASATQPIILNLINYGPVA